MIPHTDARARWALAYRFSRELIQTVEDTYRLRTTRELAADLREEWHLDPPVWGAPCDLADEFAYAAETVRDSRDPVCHAGRQS